MSPTCFGELCAPTGHVLYPHNTGTKFKGMLKHVLLPLVISSHIACAELQETAWSCTVVLTAPHDLQIAHGRRSAAMLHQQPFH